MLLEAGTSDTTHAKPTASYWVTAGSTWAAGAGEVAIGHFSHTEADVITKVVVIPDAANINQIFANHGGNQVKAVLALRSFVGGNPDAVAHDVDKTKSFTFTMPSP